MKNSKASIKAFLDSKIGPTHNYRTWMGRISSAEAMSFFGVDFGSSLIRISEKDSLIQVLRRNASGNIVNKSTNYKSVAYFNAAKPEASRFETTGKARMAIIQLMAG